MAEGVGMQHAGLHSFLTSVMVVVGVYTQARTALELDQPLEQ